MNSTETKILDGNWLSALLHKSILSEVQTLKSKFGRAPGLGVILVGDNPASRSYVARKEKVAKEECGFEAIDFFLPENASFNQVADAIKSLNENEKVDGILLQLPLPRHLNSFELIDLISPKKDADGLHPYNQGLLLRGQGNLRPCTPKGAMAMIDLAYSNIQPGSDVRFEDIPKADLAGKKAIVIGRSILVGKPLSLLLLERNCTVTQAHSKTKNIEALSAEADIVIAAVGVPELVKADWVKPGAVVIDVGINRTAEGKLIGDAHFASIAAKAAAITPVPRGVGPMTVAMLMSNTLLAYKQRVGN